MDFITWTSEGMKMYLGDEAVISLTYDELSVYLVILGVCVGLIIGLVYSYFTRIAAHRLILMLKKGGYSTAENAVTLDELGIRGKFKLRRMLKHGKGMRKVVLCANEAEMQTAPTGVKRFWYTKFLGQELPQRTDFKIARFYLPEENLPLAEKRYSCEGMSFIGLLITVVVILAVGVGAMFVAPRLIEMAEGVFGSSK